MKTEKQAPVVVITGASAGIGRATAIRFAKDGAKIALLARGKAGLEGARKEVEAMGTADRAKTRPILPLLALAKAAFDALLAAKLTVDQKTKYQAFCLYCLSSTAATFASLWITFPEERATWRELRDKK